MSRVTVVGVLVASTFAVATASVVAGHHFYHKQHRCNRRCVPRYNYGHDTPRSGATEFAVANEAVGSGIGRHKPFHFRAPTLDVDHLHLDRVGLAIYQFNGTTRSSNGTIVASGRITNDGGDGSIIGSNVTIRIRAYVAPTADPNQVPPDAFVVWESERKLWVSRGKPRYISLKPDVLRQAEKLNAHFDGITHLELELEYQRDR